MQGEQRRQEAEYAHKLRMGELELEFKRQEMLLKLDAAAETAASKIEQSGAQHECDMMQQMDMENDAEDTAEGGEDD